MISEFQNLGIEIDVVSGIRSLASSTISAIKNIAHIVWQGIYYFKNDEFAGHDANAVMQNGIANAFLYNLVMLNGNNALDTKIRGDNGLETKIRKFIFFFGKLILHIILYYFYSKIS